MIVLMRCMEDLFHCKDLFFKITLLYKKNHMKVLLFKASKNRMKALLNKSNSDNFLKIVLQRQKEI